METLTRKLACRWLLRQAVWTDGEGLRPLSGAASGGRVVVLSRDHYFETALTFPMASSKAIRAAIATDPDEYAPYGTRWFFVRRVGKDGGQTRVNLWVVNERGERLLTRIDPLLVLPETALLAASCRQTGELLKVRRGAEDLLVTCASGGEVRSTMVPAAEPAAEVRFRRAAGVAQEDAPVEGVADTEGLLARLREGLCAFPPRDLLAFAPQAALGLSARDRRRLARMGLGLAAGLLFYLAAFSALLITGERQLRRTDAKLSKRLGTVLEQQARVEDLARRHAALTGILDGRISHVALLNTLDDCLPQRTTLTGLTVSGRTVELYGLAQRASDVLEAVSGAAGFRGAAFAAPLTKEAKTGEENFKIRFEVQTPPPDGGEGVSAGSDKIALQKPLNSDPAQKAPDARREILEE